MKRIVVITAGFWVKLLLIAVLCIGVLSWCGDMLMVRQQAVMVLAGEEPVPDGESKRWQGLTQRIDEAHLSRLMAYGWPILGAAEQKEDSVAEVLLRTLLGFDPTDPYDQMGQGMAVLTLARDQAGQLSAGRQDEAVVEEDIYSDMAAMADDWHFELSKLQEIPLTDDVQVLLYHTHNAETYKPTDGVSKRAGENAGVSTAADVFQEALEKKYGLKTLHCKVLHDYPNWNRSYINSLASVKDLLNANPNVRAVFDVHRDAGFTSKDPTTITIGGEKAAKIMIVVGANHDNWQSNLAFAQALEDKSNELYPGLVRSIRIVQANRYNQQAHPHSLILEIGSDLNTQEEANYSLECFAQVVSEVLAAEQTQ